MSDDEKQKERAFVKILHADGLCNSPYEEPVPAAQQTVEVAAGMRRYIAELLTRLRRAGL